MLKTISDKFILKDILFKIVLINQDFKKHKRYKTNFNTNNNKNNSNHIFKIVEIKNIDFLSSYIYSNVYKVKQNFYFKFISTINNF